MSGFKDDIVSILRHNLMLHRESIGWVVMVNAVTPDTLELLRYIEDSKFPVSAKKTKPVVKFDYIVLDKGNTNLRNLFDAFSLVSSLGVIIIEITDHPYDMKDNYLLFGSTAVTQVKFSNRKYLVIHSGVDYGN